MRLRVMPGDVEGAIPASPSKSYSHRVMILAMMAHGTSVLKRVLLSDDTLSTLNAVRQFGAKVLVKGDTCRIKGGHMECPDDPVDAGNSGTTIRLLTGVASLLPCTTVLTGDSSIRRRPMGPLIDALQEMGVTCIPTQAEGRAPLMVRGPNYGRRAHIRGDVSSQFISSLLICSPLKDVDTEIVLTSPLISSPYVDITVELMEQFGGEVEITEEGFKVSGGQIYMPATLEVPGDFSSAAFPLVTAALRGRVTVTGLTEKTKQGDKAILDILESFGAIVKRREREIEVCPSDLHGQEVDLSSCPDLFPVVAVLAACSTGRSVLCNASHLRHKESDRIRTTVDMLRKMGAKVEEREDGCIVEGPNRLRGAIIDPHGDHRILMAASVAALVAEGETIIGDGDCYAVSYPSFVQDMVTLGARIEVME
ncbi:MAG: 3-phosphoshikimate 1-carboxyvinyltransferase [Methanomassiliicoccales archaeon]|nr:3-phosphoshikimate 1-carboxyvinyltransferase [Methanomassiliicoccales archaeon]NYT14549.1 3-phosphoshikimate 1-carboxyvinyltransferase [Methanomassiliicoccales archaeon]